MASQTIDIPGPKRSPFVGNLLQIPRGKLAQHLLALSRDFDGIFQLDFAGYRVPFVYDPDLVAELSDERRFRKIIRPPLSLLRRMAGDGLFTAHSNDKPWGKAHRILMPAFGQRAMKGYFDAMLEVAQALVAKWERQPGQDILVADDMTRLTLDTISLAGFGYRFNSFDSDQLHPFLAAMVRLLADAMSKLTRLPIVNRLSKPSQQVTDDIALMNALVDDVIRQRRQHPVETGDLLNLMLNAVDPQTGEMLDDTNIRHQVVTFLVAGHETTSGLLTFAMYMLLRNPHVLAQAYAEVDRVLPGDTVPEYGHLSRLDVIERVLKETLRLWPTAPGYAVAPYEDTVIGGRYLIRKDRSASVSIPALHRHPKAWPDPEVFDIDRFLPEAEAARHPHAYKPFGNGERACIGRQFAITEAKLALALILQKFALSDPYDYRLEIKETLTLKPDRFFIRARRRQPHERIAPAAVAAEAAPPVATATDVQLQGDGSAFLVLYGSSLGTSREIAEQIAARAGRCGFAAEVARLDDRIDELPEDGVLVVVTATYNGRAPDGASRTEAAIQQGRLPARQRLRYAVLGCGNSQWPTYQAFPKRVEQALAAIGATPLLPRGEADGNADFDRAAERWLDELWNALGGSATSTAANGQLGIEVSYSSESSIRAAALPESAQLLRVLRNEELVRDPAGLWDFASEAPRSSTRHLTLSLPDGVEYRTGDHLAVYPRNRASLVDRVIRRLSLRAEDIVLLGGRDSRLPLDKPMSLRQLLTDFVELQDPLTPRQLSRLMQHTRCPHTRGRLQALAGAFQQEVADKRLSAVDLLLQFPAIELPLAEFLSMCSALRPRFYSISSSSLTSPREISLTVGTVVGPALSGNGEYKGVASSYLQGLRAGDEVFGFVHTPAPAFTPLSEPRLPMILVGPGTGFAPFRGFLQERAAQRAQGVDVAASLVFFGCRHPDHDWFYRDEMQQWQADGIATLQLAFSCVAAHPFRFVQDALWAERAAVLAALDAGGAIYVCGDGRHMAPAVRDCLIRMHRDRYGSTLEAASEWLEMLMHSGRYLQDVFGPA